MPVILAQPREALKYRRGREQTAMAWLTETERDPRPPGDRLAALWAGPGILRLPGAHDPLAALLARKAGFQALYVSGAALSASLALPDLGVLTLPELVASVRAIHRASGLPLLVDGDTGYGEALNVVRLVRELEDAGAAAVQLEDQAFPKKCGHLSDKRLVPPVEMARKVAAAARAARHLRVVARTDALASEGLAGAVARARLYREAGAQAIFPEAPGSEEDFRAFAAAVPGPLVANMTEFGRSPLLPADRLARLGYTMVIWPVSALRVAARAMEEAYAELARAGVQTALLGRMQTRRELYETIQYHDHEALDATIAQSVLPDALAEAPVAQAGGIVVRTDGETPRVLLVRARRNPHWIFPKGHVEPGESAEAAAVREVREEAGVEAEPLAPLGALELAHGGRRVRVEHFLLRHVRTVGEGEPARQPRWCAPGEAEALLTFESSRALLRRALPLLPP